MSETRVNSPQPGQERELGDAKDRAGAAASPSGEASVHHTQSQTPREAPEPEQAAAVQAIDLNHATVEQLTEVVGEDCAKAIVGDRVHHGHFATWAELSRVPGLDAQTIAGLQRTARIGAPEAG